MWDRQGHVLDGIPPQQKDVTFDHNRAGMIFCRHRLLYHFLEGNRPVADQVAQVWWSIGGALDQGEGIMLDAESNHTEVQAFEWIQRMEEITQRPVAVYTNKRVDGGRVWNSSRIFDGTRPRIFPHYNDTYGNTVALAAPKEFDVWQYSQTGMVLGVPEAVDLDYVVHYEVFEPVCGWV